METQGAAKILYNRYIRDSWKRKADLEIVRLNSELGRLLRYSRMRAGLTQRDVAKRMGTTQSVVSRMEDVDYEGRSISSIVRFAEAVNCKMVISLEDK